MECHAEQPAFPSRTDAVRNVEEHATRGSARVVGEQPDDAGLLDREPARRVAGRLLQ